MLISKRAGFEVKPGKRLLVYVGRSNKPYPATVVDVIDGTHVRVRVDKVRRASKNNRAGYADIDVRQIMQFKSAQVKAAHEQGLRAAFPDLAARKRARADAKAFLDLLLDGDELVDQRTLMIAADMPGREGHILSTNEIRDALYRAAATLGTDEDLTTGGPRKGAARAGGVAGEGARRLAGVDAGDVGRDPFTRGRGRGRADGTGAVRVRRDDPGRLAAEQARVAVARDRAAQRDEMHRRAAAPLSGTSGDMTGMEGTSDVPLFTEQEATGNQQPVTSPSTSYNMEPGHTTATPESVRPGYSPHTVYGQSSGGADASATRRPPGRDAGRDWYGSAGRK